MTPVTWGPRRILGHRSLRSQRQGSMDKVEHTRVWEVRRRWKRASNQTKRNKFVTSNEEEQSNNGGMIRSVGKVWQKQVNTTRLGNHPQYLHTQHTLECKHTTNTLNRDTCTNTSRHTFQCTNTVKMLKLQYIQNRVSGVREVADCSRAPCVCVCVRAMCGCPSQCPEEVTR